MPIFAELLTVAKKIDNYAADATGGGLWTSTTTYEVTVPAGKRWFLLGGVIKPDTSATTSTTAYNAADEPLYKIGYQAAGTNLQAMLKQTADYNHANPHGHPLVLDAGDYVDVEFGAAQGASAYCSCVVLEVDV